MFCPPPEEEPQTTSQAASKNHNKKRKKRSGRKNSQWGVGKNKKKHGKLAISMSAWAENFTFAATWQLKHQLAYWKARAKALDYENRILHEIIRKKNYVGPTPQSSVRSDSQNELRGSQPSTEFEYDIEDEEESNEEQEDEDLEVSEEFIQFLQANAKYREDARQERERLKAKNSEDNAIKEMEAGPSEPEENNEEKLKKLYGDKWQRICALEMSLQSQFIHDSDKDKPAYWPNIPFNFNFG